VTLSLASASFLSLAMFQHRGASGSSHIPSDNTMKSYGNFPDGLKEPPLQLQAPVFVGTAVRSIMPTGIEPPSCYEPAQNRQARAMAYIRLVEPLLLGSA